MAYRLALDVGTASCGLVVWALDPQLRPIELAFNSLDIWAEPLLPAKAGGMGEPKKAARRTARMMRRSVCRRARRLRRIAHLGALLGLNPSAITPDGGQNIHRLRALAVEERIELVDFLRVMLKLAKNRGPSGDWVYAQEEKPAKKASGKKIARSDNEVGSVKTAEQGEKAKEKKGIVGGVRKLEGLIEETRLAAGKETLTLGQYLHIRRERGDGIILGKPEIGLYPSRRLVEIEFDRIWTKQADFHPPLRIPEVREKFSQAIFFQRPLKSPAPMVGRCPLEPTLPRSPAAQMAAQIFRIEKQLADLRWGMGHRHQPLSKEQQAVIREILNAQGEVAFGDIIEALSEAGHPAPIGQGLNMDRSSRESLKGNVTAATFRKLGLENEWRSLDERTQIQVINFLADLGSPDSLDSDDWHHNFVTQQKDERTGQYKHRQFAPALVGFVDLLRRHPKFGRLSAMGFDGGRMGYSVKAMGRITALMQEGWDERRAVEQAYPRHFNEKPISGELPLPEETGNTVVDVALRQVYRAVRRAMSAMKEAPTQVIVELSRDMALGLKQRGEIETRININTKARRDAAKEITEHGEPVTDKKIDRYLLWESQSHYCPYCAHRIELGEALGRGTEREHILPRSLTRVGGKRSQLVLAHRTCNQQKGDRTPWHAFGADKVRWRIVEDRAAQLERNKQWGKAKLLVLKDWETEVLDDEAVKGFTDRQFHESSWIAKLTAQWLRHVCVDVAVSRGEMTAHLRRIWKLDTVIPQVRLASGLPALDRDGAAITPEEFDHHKGWWEGHDGGAGAAPTDRKPDKRIDHRHHLVDALVISLTDRKLFKKMADNYKLESEKAQRGERARLTRFVEPPFMGLRDLAVDIIARAEVRHKPDRHPDGALFEQTAYGISRRPDESGKYLLAVSESLPALLDIKGGSVEKTRKGLEKIESEITRNAVLKAFDERITSGVPLKQVFDKEILHPQFGTPIYRVRLLRNSAETAATVFHENRFNSSNPLKKRYVHSGNAYLEIRVEDGKVSGKPRLVNILEAMQEKGSRPPSGVVRFWKGDTVVLSDGTEHVVGQIKAESNGRLCLIPSTEACGFDDLSKRGLTKRTISGGSLAQVQVKNV